VVSKLGTDRECEFRVDGRRQFVRGGPLQPGLLVALLLFLVREGHRRGYDRMLEAFWDEAQSYDIALPTEQPVSKQAFCAARRRLPSGHVRDLVRQAAGTFDTVHGGQLRWHGRRLLAVDGARRSVQASDELVRECGRSSGAHYPQVHVSTLFDVVSHVPLDVEVGPSGTDERAQLMRHLEHARAGDVLVLDAGYPAFDVFATLLEQGCDVICRLPTSNTFGGVVDFVESGAREAWIVLDPPGNSSARALGPIHMRALRVPRKDDTFWVLLTTLDESEFSYDAIVDGYTRRWRIEEYYKLLVAPYFHQGMFHARNMDGVRQEIYAQMLFVVLSQHLAAVAAKRHAVPYRELSQKAAILAVGDHLTRLVLSRPIDRARPDLERLMRRIARAREKPRPGRSSPRVSLQPLPRWGRKGRRIGG